MIFPCADIGERPKSEFRWGGYLHPRPESGGAEEWHQHLWQGEPAGLMREWWFHAPSDRWYLAERDVASETFVWLRPAEDVDPALLNTAEVAA